MYDLSPLTFHPGFSDPYVVVKYGHDTMFKSRVVKKSLNPEWHESVTLSAPPPDDVIKVVSHCLHVYQIHTYVCE